MSVEYSNSEMRCIATSSFVLQGRACGICDGEYGIAIGFGIYWCLPCQYHSTIAPYSFIHLPPTLYNIFLPVLQFPLSVSFHHYSILIHSSTTHAL